MSEFTGFASIRSALRVGALLVAMAVLPAAVHAQSPTPDSAAAARELVTTMKIDAQFKALLPIVIQTMKPAIVQNRPEVDRAFDALAPQLLSGFEARLNELSDAIVAIYANNFTADELRALTAFYRTPAGQKFLEKTPLIGQQTMAAGQKFGQSVGAEAQQRMIQELRSKGINP